MTSITFNIEWEFDLHDDPDALEMVGCAPDEYEDLSDEDKQHLYEQATILYGVPAQITVNSDDDPEFFVNDEVDYDALTDYLSDEYGWLVAGLEVDGSEFVEV